MWGIVLNHMSPPYYADCIYTLSVGEQLVLSFVGLIDNICVYSDPLGMFM